MNIKQDVVFVESSMKRRTDGPDNFLFNNDIP
jgi:hypothetical protein